MISVPVVERSALPPTRRRIDRVVWLADLTYTQQTVAADVIPSARPMPTPGSVASAPIVNGAIAPAMRPTL